MVLHYMGRRLQQILEEREGGIGPQVYHLLQTLSGTLASLMVVPNKTVPFWSPDMISCSKTTIVITLPAQFVKSIKL